MAIFKDNFMYPPGDSGECRGRVAGVPATSRSPRVQEGGGAANPPACMECNVSLGKATFPCSEPVHVFVFLRVWLVHGLECSFYLDKSSISVPCAGSSCLFEMFLGRNGKALHHPYA